MNSLERNVSKAEKDKQKMIQDRCQNLLNQMLRDEDNKYCVDCDAKGPRWASWNIGIFLCIRCAGIHRNLGVHISKVKSVNLDTWTPEQVVSLQMMGNSRARAVYEASLPDTWRRPQTDSSLESFIRAKYQHKRYIAKEWVPQPVPKVDWDKEIEEEMERLKKRKKEPKTNLPSIRKPISDTPVPPLPKPSSSPKTTRISLNETKKNASVDLLGLDTPPVVTNTTTSDNQLNQFNQDDVFSNFLSAPPVSATCTTTTGSESGDNDKRRSSEEENFFNQTLTTHTASADNKMTKDSILALYGSSTTQQPVYNNTLQGGIFPPQPVSFVPANNMFNGMIQQTPPSMFAAQSQQMASNPFFNMASTGQTQFGGQSQHDTCKPPDDLMAHFTSTVTNKLPQQMACLNLNPTAIQSQNLVGVQNAYQPMGVPSYNQFRPPNMAPTASASATPATAANGQTLTMHLWQ